MSDISYSLDLVLMFIPPSLSFLNYFCLVLILTNLPRWRLYDLESQLLIQLMGLINMLTLPETFVIQYEGNTKILSVLHLICGTAELGVQFKLFIR